MKTYCDRRTQKIRAAPDCVFRVVCRVGGTYGWFSPRWIWRLRGWMDRVVGGPGLRAGRRHPKELRVGDTIDFWRVDILESPKRLQLTAEMKLPGEGTLEFDLAPGDNHLLVTRLRQTAEFTPNGLWGKIYWMLLTPVHKYVFQRMISGIARVSEREEGIVLSKPRVGKNEACEAE